MRSDIQTEIWEGYLERNHAYPAVIKPLLDFCIAAILLIITSPFLLLIAIGIKVHSPGPVFFRQQRIGKDGKPFEMLKFRSMRVDADQQYHKEYVKSLIQNNTRPEDLGRINLKLAHDPRITGLGKILRGFGLDELPQLINVLKGEMSIVGPRPSMAYEYEDYQSWHKYRHAVLPGITGLWQIIAHDQVSFDEMVSIDIKYIREMNLFLDLKIMALTPLEMLKKRG